MTTGTASQHDAGDITGPVRVGDVVADKYQIERTLGVGGMGVVVAARDQVLDRRVAIKFLLPKLAGSETAVQRFVREARAATRLTSEHVVRLLEIEKLPSGTPFFVMEYLEGRDLRALLRESGAVSSTLAVDYMLQALQAVAEGHVKGIVHRDIKPGNLFLTTRADGTALIKVLDFGIAKTLESDAAEASSLTSSDDVRLGSPAYMPPEQLQNPRDVDKRSDIWSVGATLYELICGRPAFEGPGYFDLATRILSQPPSPLSERPLPTPLPAGLEQVIEKCLEKDRARRYSDAAELAMALAPFGSDDARMSLSRVRGTLSSMSSLSALVSSIPRARATATRPVPNDPAVPQAVTQTGNIRTTANINAAAQARPARSWLVLGAVAVILLGAAGLRSLEPTRAVPLALPKLDAPAALPAAAPTVVVTPPASTLPVPPAAPAARTAGPRVKRETIPPPPAGARRVAQPAPDAQTSAAVQRAVPSDQGAAVNAGVPDQPTDEMTTGRSQEIERLIERRR
jgi:eukaryotic-like serine/threonine-protein kinase